MRGRIREYTPIEFQTNLVKLLTRNNMTKTELANRIGYDYKTVLAWSQGDSVPSAVGFMRLCDLFRIDPTKMWRGRVDD